MSVEAVLSAAAGTPGTRLGKLLGEGLEPVAPLRGVTGALQRIVADTALSGGGGGDIPDGPARPEALAVRLRDSGGDIRWGDPVVFDDLGSLLEFCRARGRSSVEVARAEPSLVSGMQIGAWFDAPWRTRALRRLVPRAAHPAVAALGRFSRRWLLAAADLAFWSGVRELATESEWRRLTASSYVALVYHRFAGELKPGQERYDIAPRRFARQLRALRLAGCRPLSGADVVALHSGEGDGLPRRGVAITVDDALADCVGPLRRHADWAPQLFVSTRELGGVAHWLDGEPVAGWDEVSALSGDGVSIGSHARSHRRLTSLDAEQRDGELAGSLADLRERLAAPLEALAFPHGDHDAETCRAARDAGYRAAYTTEKGRNGAAADPHCLKRVSVHGHDGAPAVLWKAFTGEALPPWWPRLRKGR